MLKNKKAKLELSLRQKLVELYRDDNQKKMLVEIARSENLHDLMLKVSKKRGELLKLITTDD